MVPVHFAKRTHVNRPPGRFCFGRKYAIIYDMKRFERYVDTTKGSLPPQIRALVAGRDIAAATNEFNAYMTALATDFHRQLADGADKNDIVLTAPGKLFGHDVKLDYVASGSMGSVYKMEINGHEFAFKINRNSAHGELYVMPLQQRARGLVNPVHIGAVFEYGGRKYSWVLSDYISHDRADSFEAAQEKMYYMYLTKGLTVTDSHPNNFKDGKLIDTPSLTPRYNRADDIRKLTRVEQNIVQRLAYCIKTNDIDTFARLVATARTKNPAVINYMFLAMKLGRPTMAWSSSDNKFINRLRKFERVIDTVYHAGKASPEFIR